MTAVGSPAPKLQSPSPSPSHNAVPVLVISENDPVAHVFVRSAVVWMNDFVVLVLIFGNLMYAVHCSKSIGQMPGRDKRKVSEAVRSIRQRRDSAGASSHRKVLGGQLLEQDERSVKSKSGIKEVSFESDTENGSVIHAPSGGTHRTSGSRTRNIESEVVVSALSMSGFEGSGHEDMSPVVMTPNSKSKAESAARWETSSGPSSCEKGELANSYGPTIPTRGETVFDQPEESSGAVPSNPQMSNFRDEEVGCHVEAEGENSKQISIPITRHFQDSVSDVSERLTSIAELEWSDEEENLTNQTPPALLESASPEQAPVMPRRSPTLRESTPPEQAPIMPKRSRELKSLAPPEQAPVTEQAPVMPRRFDSEVLDV